MLCRRFDRIITGRSQQRPPLTQQSLRCPPQSVISYTSTCTRSAKPEAAFDPQIIAIQYNASTEAPLSTENTMFQDNSTEI